MFDMVRLPVVTRLVDFLDQATRRSSDARALPDRNASDSSDDSPTLDHLTDAATHVCPIPSDRRDAHGGGRRGSELDHDHTCGNGPVHCPSDRTDSVSDHDTTSHRKRPLAYSNIVATRVAKRAATNSASAFAASRVRANLHYRQCKIHRPHPCTYSDILLSSFGSRDQRRGRDRVSLTRHLSPALHQRLPTPAGESSTRATTTPSS